jgi:hypothetical protein
MGQVYQCWWRICRDMNVFFLQVRISLVLPFISTCDVFTDCIPYVTYILHRSTVPSWLRHYATSRQVAGSILHEAIGCFN